MALQNKNGESISYDSLEQIERLQNDIEEHGETLRVFAKSKDVQGVRIYTSYRYDDGKPEEGEMPFTAEQLLYLLFLQDSVF